MELSVTCADDLERQIVKSDSCSVVIPEMEFSIEPNPEHRHGMFSNVTGILNDAKQGVEYMAWGWKQQIQHQPEDTEKILAMLNDLNPKMEQIDTLLEGNIPFTFIFDDPSGNSYISSNASGSTAQDPMIKKTYYTRTPEQDAMLGLMREENLGESWNKPGSSAGNDDDGVLSSSKPLNTAAMPKGASTAPKVAYDDSSWLNFEPSSQLDEAVMQFGSWCESCGKECQCNMYQFSIPHFREVILMSATCEHCGNRSREIKPGGSVPDQGRRCTLRVDCEDDLGRGIIKSDSASIRIPELEFELEQGTLGGMFTTIEGLIMKISEHLLAANPFADLGGNEKGVASLMNETEIAFRNFIKRLDGLLKLEEKFTIILEDPMAGSFIENPDAPAEDSKLDIEDYDRSFEENEDLGINDMVTEGYEGADALAAVAAAELAAKQKAEAEAYNLAHPQVYKDFDIPEREDFWAEDCWVGCAKGFVFKLGEFGQGYYRDTLAMAALKEVAAAVEEVAAAAKEVVPAAKEVVPAAEEVVPPTIVEAPSLLSWMPIVVATAAVAVGGLFIYKRMR